MVFNFYPPSAINYDDRRQQTMRSRNLLISRHKVACSPCGSSVRALKPLPSIVVEKIGELRVSYFF